MAHFLYVVLGGLCVYFACINLLPVKPTGLKRIIIFLYPVITACIMDYFVDAYGIPVMVLGTFLLIYLFSVQRWLNLSLAIFGYLCVVTCNYLCIGIVQKVLHMSLEQMEMNSYIIATFSVCYSVLCYVLTRFLGWLLNTKLEITTVLSDPPLPFCLFINMFLLGTLFIFNVFYGAQIGYSYGAVAFNGILFLILFIAVTLLIVYLYRTIEQRQQANAMLTQYESLQTYTAEVEKLYGNMRSFKHDYINILSTISGHIDRNDMPALREQFYRDILPLSREFSESDSRLGMLSYVTSQPLKSLISSKLIYSLELGIETEIEIMESITEIPIDILDLSRIIGIFFDNAIEAAMETEEKFLRFCMITNDSRLVIMLQNTAKPPVHTISALTTLGVSSKGEHRGTGLYNAEKLLQPYKNVMWDTTYIKPYFTQTLTLFY